MIQMFLAIWMVARHGQEAAIIAALTWGVMDTADYIVERKTGHSVAEHVIAWVQS